MVVLYSKEDNRVALGVKMRPPRGMVSATAIARMKMYGLEHDPKLMSPVRRVRSLHPPAVKGYPPPSAEAGSESCPPVVSVFLARGPSSS